MRCFVIICASKTLWSYMRCQDFVIIYALPRLCDHMHCQYFVIICAANTLWSYALPKMCDHMRYQDFVIICAAKTWRGCIYNEILSYCQSKQLFILILFCLDIQVHVKVERKWIIWFTIQTTKLINQRWWLQFWRF